MDEVPSSRVVAVLGLPAAEAEPFAARLEEAIDAVTELAPGIIIDVDGLVDALQRHWPESEGRRAALPELHLRDLLLATACRGGDPAALNAFATIYARELRGPDKPTGRRGVDADDLRQILLERFFVGRPGRPPGIDTYSGKGALHGWIRVASTRIRIDLSRRRADQDEPLDTQGERRLEASAIFDQELALLRQRYRDAMGEAFAEALRTLTDRQRTILRLSVVETLSATKIARLYQVDRATAKRWLSRVRSALFDQTKAALRRRLEIDSREFESILRMIRTHFDVSVHRMLDSTQD